LIGENYGTISNSYSSSKTTGKRNVGGLVGRNGSGIEGRAYGSEMLWTGGTIINSHSSGMVTGNSLNIGGLVGDNSYGKVFSSYSSGIVTGKEYIGGLVGNNTDGTVSNCYSTGIVTGEEEVGGLVGDNLSGTVSNSYSSSKAIGKRIVGSLVGANSYGSIVNSYSIGTVAEESALVGWLFVPGGIVSNSYYDKQTSKGLGKGKATKEMQSKAFADSLNFIAGLLSAKAWIHSPGKYPVLSEQDAPMPNMDRFFAGGSGTETNPYVISTKKHLENLAYFVNFGATFLGKHIKLSQNIKVSKWTSIGKGRRSFQGTFDGNGFAVSGISGELGLFGALGSSGTIKNLGVTNVDIKGDNHAAGLVGDNEGTISGSYCTGKVAAKYDFAGGLVGCNCGDSSRIINSYSTASVSGQNHIGGLVGTNKGFISGSYSTGKVSGTARYLTQTLSDLRHMFPRRPNKGAGGLVGSNEGTIINSHSSSDVTGIEYVGGLVGDNEGTISGSYCTGKVNKNYLVGAGKEAVDSSYYCNEKK